MTTMDIKQDKKGSSDFTKAERQLERCLQQLKNTNDDNEKIASLLLFTHIMKTQPGLTVPPNILFQAIGVEFITRLLTTVTVPEGCPWFIYKALALNILTSFSDNELYHPEIASNLPQILTVILTRHEGSQETGRAYDDALKILLLYSRSKQGCGLLSQHDVIPMIIQHLLKTPNTDTLFDILHSFLIQFPNKIWAENTQDLEQLLKLFSQTFAESQEMIKFDVSQKLLNMLQSLCNGNMIVCEVSQNNPNSFVIDGDCSKNLRKGIQDILQSKCKIQYKYTALCSASLLIEQFGVASTVTEISLNLSNTTFWFVVLSITKTELIMILEEDSFDKIEQHSPILIACYKILEKTIEFLIGDKNESWCLRDNVVLKVHSILVQCFSAIMEFLIHLKTTTLIDEDIYCYKQPIIIATVRVLCSWFSEETNALSEKVTQVLPILLNWVKTDLCETGNECETHENRQLQGEILSYLLPPLCHFSADETFCPIIISQGAHITLIQYFEDLWKEHKNGNEQSIITLCNIFLNFCVLQIDLIKNEAMFGDVLNLIMNSLGNIVKQPDMVVITAHFILLGLMLFRHKYRKNNLTDNHIQFLKNAIDFLRLTQPSSETDTDNLSAVIHVKWDEISEIWFLSLQNIIACSKMNTEVKNILESSGWINETQHWLNKNEGSASNSNLVPIAQLD